MLPFRKIFVTCAVLGLAACGKSKFGSVTVGGKTIDRLADKPVAPDAASQAGVDVFMGTFGTYPTKDFRTAEAANNALTLSVVDASGASAKLGTVAYVRPGLGNIAFSPADILLLSQHFDKVVLLYTNMTDTTPGATDFRRVTSLGVDRTTPVQGFPPSNWEHVVPVPASITNIYAIGSPQLNIISFTQQSDVTLDQLAMLHDHQSELGFDALTAGGTVFAHSQGAADVVLTQDRLTKAGLHGFDNIVTVGSAIKGGRLLSTAAAAKVYIDGAKVVGGAIAGDQAATALSDLQPSESEARMEEGLNLKGKTAATDVENRIRSFVTAGFGGAIDPNATDHGIARAGFVQLAIAPDPAGNRMPNDGAENIDSITVGQVNYTFPEVDHITSIEEPDLMRNMLQVLANLQNGTP